ncbi:MAG TPA: hypothetical protein VEI28_00650 [Thermodesulfovibrionales bacterium]|nr:hypothetical protein [Thermodesulfovibrionales bacterium]
MDIAEERLFLPASLGSTAVCEICNINLAQGSFPSLMDNFTIPLKVCELLS